MKLQSVLTALVMASVVLAGCTKGDETPDNPALDPTKGSIVGLLVDDNFRPVQLQEDWGSQDPGDFQDQGFILLVEQAKRIETNANGEFIIEGLEPDTYTLQVAAENHEAITGEVTVIANEEASITLEARRKASGSNPILTIEFTGFVPCATAGIVSSTSNCIGDLSGDAYRPGPILDYRETYGTDAHYIVVEAVTNQKGEFTLAFREDDVTGSGGRQYAEVENADLENPYMKLILENSAVYGRPTDPPATWTGDPEADLFYIPQHNPRFVGQHDGSMACGPEGQENEFDPDTKHSESDYCSWPNSFPDPTVNDGDGEAYNPIEALVFFTREPDAPVVPGHGIEEPNPVTGNPIACREDCSTYGFRAAVKINYIISIFIGEPTATDSAPEDDLNDYCVYCKGYLDEI